MSTYAFIYQLMHSYVSICIHIPIYAFIYQFIYQLMRLHVSISIHISTYAFICQHMHSYVNMYIHMSTYVLICHRMYWYVNIYIHMSMYACICQHVYSYANICTHMVTYESILITVEIIQTMFLAFFTLFVIHPSVTRNVMLIGLSNQTIILIVKYWTEVLDDNLNTSQCSTPFTWRNLLSITHTTYKVVKTCYIVVSLCGLLYWFERSIFLL